MQKLRIKGGNILNGNVRISGAKNAALPLIVCSLLSEQKVKLDNVPNLSDVNTLCELLESLGANITRNLEEGKIEFNNSNVNSTRAEYDIVKKMRASVIVLGALLARFGEAEVSLPGGCAIGTRPVDLHLKALEAMGVNIELKDGYILAKGRPQAGTYEFPIVSVGASQNAILAASMAEGRVILKNVALEPEVTALAGMLRIMGARIKGIGTHNLVIDGVKKLNGCDLNVIPDRIEAGTYAIAAAITGGDVTLNNVSPDLLSSVLVELERAGCKIDRDEYSLNIKGPSEGKPKPVSIVTKEYPYFPTDMQAQFMAFMTLCKGECIISEKIFENRFMHVPELVRMGADITIDGDSAIVRGVDKLGSAQVMASDLRASASLVIASLAAEGTSIVDRIYHLDRGYEELEQKLSNLGANIERVTE